MHLAAIIDIKSHLSLLDVAVFAFVLALTMAVVVWGERRKKSGGDAFLDHLLMGRTLTLPLFTATMMASWYGGIFGVTEIAFRHGIYNFLTQGVFWYATYIIFALFLVQKIAKYKAVTLPELVGQMFGPKSAKVAAVFNFFNVVPIAYTLSLGLFVQALFGWPLWFGIGVSTVFVCAYSIWGGFRAVVYSDLIQFFVMCLAVFLVVYYSVSLFGGISFLKSSLPDSHFAPLGGHSLATTFVWGFIALSTLVDPNFYQKCFAAENPATARRGILICTVIWALFDLCTTAGAMYARAALPNADPGQSYLVYAVQILPDGLRGLFLAGVLATILSTLDAYIFIASNTLSYDLGPAHVRKNLHLHKFNVAFIGVAAAGMSFLFDGSVKTVWKILGSYSAGCLLVPMMIGYFRPERIGDLAFVTGSLLGAVAMTYWRVVPHGGFWADVDELYIGLVATSAGVFLGHWFHNRRKYA